MRPTSCCATPTWRCIAPRLTGAAAAAFFEPEMDRRIQARRALELDLRKAFANGEFDLHYQPLINLDGDRISGFEALLRWHHPERGMVPPERVHRAGRRDRPDRRRSANGCCARPAPKPRAGPAISRSPSTCRPCSFAPAVVQAVLSALAHPGLPPQRLELEITESGCWTRQKRRSRSSISCARSARGSRWMILAPAIRAQLSAQLSVRQDQDRPLVRARSGRASRLHSDHSRGRGSGRESRGLRPRPKAWRRANSSIVFVPRGVRKRQGFLFSKPRPAAELMTLLGTASDRAKVA